MKVNARAATPPPPHTIISSNPTSLASIVFYNRFHSVMFLLFAQLARRGLKRREEEKKLFFAVNRIHLNSFSATLIEFSASSCVQLSWVEHLLKGGSVGGERRRWGIFTTSECVSECIWWKKCTSHDNKKAETKFSRSIAVRLCESPGTRECFWNVRLPALAEQVHLLYFGVYREHALVCFIYFMRKKSTEHHSPRLHFGGSSTFVNEKRINRRWHSTDEQQICKMMASQTSSGWYDAPRGA